MSIKAIYGQGAVDVNLPTFSPTVVTAKSATRIVVVQKIVFTPTVYAAATLSFSDSLTGVVIGVITVPATAGPVVVLDYGLGTKLSTGASLNYNVSANGATGRLHIESVQKGR